MSTSSKNNKIMKFENSSAIENINFSKNDGIIGITFRQGKEYDFTTDNVSEIEEKFVSADANGESIGKLYNSLLREDRLRKVITT